MFKKIKAKIESMQPQNVAVDLSRFNDPLAENVDWNPLKRGGSNFRTHKLKNSNDPIRLAFQATKGALFFSGVFAVAGLIIPIVMISQNLKDVATFSNPENFFIAAFSLLFVGAGIGMAYYFNRPIVFDKQIGYFWKGRKVPQMYSKQNPKNSVRLDKIHAIQLISERVKSDKGSYLSYELNLILRDGSRINVIDHGSAESVRTDAKHLSSFLGKPVWDTL